MMMTRQNETDLIDRDVAYERLSNLLHEMQLELSMHNWTPHERLERACQLRKDIFYAVADYRDACQRL
jgi:hypothetical protein